MQDLNILYFGWVREVIGLDEEHIERPIAGTRIDDIVAMLGARGGGYAEAFSNTGRVRAALDQHFVPLDTVIGDAREIALFPPVTGG